MVRPRPVLHLYVVAVALAAAAAGVAVALVDSDLSRRAWLLPVVGLLLTLEHLFETGVVHGHEERERIGLQEGYLVALAMLASPLGTVIVFASALAVGGVLARRPRLKWFFNVSAFTLGTALGMLCVALVERSTGSVPALAGTAVGAGIVLLAVNRVLIASVLALAGSGRTVASHLGDDLGAQGIVTAADVSIGLLAGLAALSAPWSLPFALAAMAVLHVALGGHAHARAERQKLEDLVASTSDGIVTLDRDGHVASWNEASREITGYPAERVLGLRLGDVAGLLQASAEAFESEQRKLSAETIAIRTAGGETRWISIRRTPLPEWGWVLVLRDETARRQIEELRGLQESERLRADLVAAVSHELRTPLTSILGFVETVLQRDLPLEERRRFLEIAREQAVRLQRLVDDLLDLRRLSAGAALLERETIDIAALLREQAEALAPAGRAHELKLDVPPHPLQVDADPFRLRQVVANLVSNAIKYSPSGGVVGLRATAADAGVRIEVADEGLGIPESAQRHLFEPFFRAEDPAVRAIGGAGLGLALSREIVKAHGGTIGFESRKGEGSTFFVELPPAT
jgi:PAS domain S-box-containing protein